MIRNLLVLPAFSYFVLARNELEDMLLNTSEVVPPVNEESYLSDGAKADRVTSMPVIGDLPDETFSGFIDISNQRE